jgi:hypothetical protein
MIHKDMNDGVFPVCTPIDSMSVDYTIEPVTDIVGILIGLWYHLTLFNDFQGCQSRRCGERVGIECSGVENPLFSILLSNPDTP